MEKKIFSTFEIAAMLQVGSSTVITWINAKKLAAFRTPGGHRRVREEVLLDFLRAYNMPLPDELAPQIFKILIVEDDGAGARQIRGLLDQLGGHPEVFTAKDGFSAGELVALHAPDLIILNLLLPGLDGIETCRKIRSQPASRKARILALSAKGGKDLLDRAIEAGADMTLEKPIQPDAFLKKVRVLLKPS